MNELTTREHGLKLIQGGREIKRRGGAIALLRPRKPRRLVRVALEPSELREAKPIALLPMPEHVRALPPFQRLSLAQRIQITYARQQKKPVRTRLQRTDRMVHRENVLNWRVEIWQIGATRGTDKPRFFFRTESLILGARGGQNRRSKSEFDTPHDCLKVARWKAQDRESLWRGKGRGVGSLPVKKHRRALKRYMPIYKVARDVIEQAIKTMVPVPDPAICPVCREEVERNRYALNTHLAAHVSKALISTTQQFEIISFLVEGVV